MDSEMDEKMYEQKYRQGEQYLFNREYEKAYNILIELANENVGWSDNAKYRLGQMYYYGTYVERDYEKAYEYFKSTAHPDAYYFLGEMYYYGYFVEKDYEKAYKIFSELQSYHPKARYMIGRMYCYGQHLEKNYDEARKIFNALVEERNDKQAKHMLGMIKYFEDGTIPEDGLYY